MKVISGMVDIPKFILYGDGDPAIQAVLNPSLGYKDWGDLSKSEKGLALRELRNQHWFKRSNYEILDTIVYLNRRYLSKCPGPNLHRIIPNNSPIENNMNQRLRAAFEDFYIILNTNNLEVFVMPMLSKWAECHIDKSELKQSEKVSSVNLRAVLIEAAYKEFDKLAESLNHIFEQFSLNQLVTRTGFVPRQDDKITKDIYVPTLTLLADSKWKSVNDDLAKMFEDYSSRDFAEVIAKAHSAVQRFLQILVGEEGKSGKGEVGKLFSKAKKEGLIEDNQFTGPMIKVIQGYISSERANNSTAKPSQKEASSTDALLMMNVVMVLLQHCLQSIK